jgi:hypothetical protein
MNCPNCHDKTHLRDMGWVKLRHIFKCSRCGSWLEAITKLRTLPENDRQLILALGGKL